MKIHRLLLLLSLAPQPNLCLGLLYNIFRYPAEFLGGFKTIFFLQGRFVSPTPIPEI
jgi:hypothetical protein